MRSTRRYGRRQSGAMLATDPNIAGDGDDSFGRAIRLAEEDEVSAWVIVVRTTAFPSGRHEWRGS